MWVCCSWSAALFENFPAISCAVLFISSSMPTDWSYQPAQQGVIPHYPGHALVDPARHGDVGHQINHTRHPIPPLTTPPFHDITSQKQRGHHAARTSQEDQDRRHQQPSNAHIAQSHRLAQPFLHMGGGVLTFPDSLLSLPLPDFPARYDIRPSHTGDPGYREWPRMGIDALGADSALGEGSEDRPQHLQRTGRNGSPKARLSGTVGAPPLHHPRDGFLRMAATGNWQKAALVLREHRWAGIGFGGPLGPLEGR